LQVFYKTCKWNEYNLNPLTRNNWRASLVPAAAVIPAPIAYIKVVAVKKLVVGFWLSPVVRLTVVLPGSSFFSLTSGVLNWVLELGGTFTVRKLECSKQAFA